MPIDINSATTATDQFIFFDLGEKVINNGDHTTSYLSLTTKAMLYDDASTSLLALLLCRHLHDRLTGNRIARYLVPIAFFQSSTDAVRSERREAYIPKYHTNHNPRAP